jgi:hypothetical protein
MCLLAVGGCANLSFLPAETAATLANPSHVEAYRTGTLDAHPGYGGKMDGFAVIGAGQVSADLAKQIGQLAIDPATYRDATRRGEFVPVVGYRFYRHLSDGRGQMSVDMLISFDSDEVLLVARDGKLRENFRRLLESDPARQSLLDLTRQVFPLDVPVQSIPDVGEPNSDNQSGPAP